MRRFLISLIAILTLASIGYGCGAGTGGNNGVGSAISSSSLSGHVIDAPINAGNVQAYPLDDGGALGKPEGTVVSYPVEGPLPVSGSVVTAPDGQFALEVPSTGAVLIRCTSGSFIDSVTGESFGRTEDDPLDAAIVLPYSGEVEITPLTHMAAQLAIGLARGGTSPEDAVNKANQAVGQFYCIEDIYGTQPLELSQLSNASQEVIDYSLIVAGIADYASQNNLDPSSLVQGLGADASDGTLDGMWNGAGVSVLNRDRSGTVTLDKGAGTTGLAQSIIRVQSGSTVTASSSLIAGLKSGNGSLGVTPATYSSPYGMDFTYTDDQLTGDFNEYPRNQVSAESETPFDEWYGPTLLADDDACWGPGQALYPPPVIPEGVDSVKWERERVLAVANKYIGYYYQHHHIPDWSPPQGWPWKDVSFSRQSQGLDCSDFSAWVYNYGLGLMLETDVVNQAQGTTLPGSSGEGPAATAQTILDTADGPVTYAQIVSTLRRGDLLYIRSDSNASPGAGISHVIMWVGVTRSSSAPLIIDAHDNSPPVEDVYGVTIPAGVYLRPFKSDSWYCTAYDHAHRWIYYTQ